ncbi:glycosyl transferase [Achromatium sp. WMS2]|nr:glycosyl transferase [Achromatium sp. WMS2]
MATNKKIIISINTTWNFVNFRVGLIKALLNKNWEITAIAPADKYVKDLKQLNCNYIHLLMHNKSTNPIRDLFLFWRFYLILYHERPAIFLGYTVKPNIYGSLAAHALGIPVINNIAGLGTIFINNSWITHLVHFLYWLALSRSAKVFFQNNDDLDLFVKHRIVRIEQTERLPGSGVDLSRFTPVPLPSLQFKKQIRFLLIARMLWDKGVGEYVAAARIVRQNHPNAEFCLLGQLSVQNPAAIDSTQMRQWKAEGMVRYLGTSDDVRVEIADADCIVLPSYYREGVPRTLLEAAAMGRPIITTDAVGCREVVNDGVNGYLCKTRNVIDLAEKIIKMLKLSPEDRTEMGRQGRAKVEREFDEKIVIQKYLDAIQEVTSS